MKMVGLYHKRRAERSQSKVLSCMIRAGAAAGAFTVVGFTLVAIFFNGTAIKGPLGSYLSKQTGLDVTIEDAEFSPVYPDVIKLNNVKVNCTLSTILALLCLMMSWRSTISTSTILS